MTKTTETTDDGSALRGVIVPILTPLTPDGAVDTGSLRRLVNFLLDNGVHGIWAAGTTGEFAALSAPACRLVIETVADEVAGRAPVIGNISAPATAAAIEAAREVRGIPLDGIAATPPYYYTHVTIQPEPTSRWHFRIAGEDARSITLTVLAWSRYGSAGGRTRQCCGTPWISSAALSSSAGALLALVNGTRKSYRPTPRAMAGQRSNRSRFAPLATTLLGPAGWRRWQWRVGTRPALSCDTRPQSDRAPVGTPPRPSRTALSTVHAHVSPWRRTPVRIVLRA